MASITAQQVIDEAGYETEDIHSTAATAKTRVEYLIDNIIDFVNGETGLSISNMSGSAGSKSATVTSQQAPIIKAGAILLIRAYLDKGPNATLEATAITAVASDPQYNIYTKLFFQGINRLRGRSFTRT